LIAPTGARLAVGGSARGSRRRSGWTFAAIGVAVLAVVTALFVRRPEKRAVPAAAPIASSAAPTTEFPRDPDLKRAFHLIYDVVGGIAEDFALADDLVKPLLAARPNDPE